MLQARGTNGNPQWVKPLFGLMHALKRRPTGIVAAGVLIFPKTLEVCNAASPTPDDNPLVTTILERSRRFQSCPEVTCDYHSALSRPPSRLSETPVM